MKESMKFSEPGPLVGWSARAQFYEIGRDDGPAWARDNATEALLNADALIAALDGKAGT